MTVQVDSQLVTDQNMWHIDMCCINNSISCLEKKTTFGTHEQTCYVDFNVGLPPPPHPELIGRPSVALVGIKSWPVIGFRHLMLEQKCQLIFWNIFASDWCVTQISLCL